MADLRAGRILYHPEELESSSSSSRENNEATRAPTTADLADGVHDANRIHEAASPSPTSEEEEERQQEASAAEYLRKCWSRRDLGTVRAGLVVKWMDSRAQWTVRDEESTMDGVLAAFREEMGVHSDG